MELLRKIAAGIVTLAILGIVGGVIVFLTVPDLFRDPKADIKALRMSGDQRGLATGLETYSVGQPPAPEGAAGTGIDGPKEAGEKPNPFFK